MANEYLKRTPTSTGNRKTWTVSFWHKRNATSGYNNFYTTQGSSPYLSVGNFNANGTIQICRNESGTVTELNTTSVFKDTSSWMHIMVSWDTTSSTSSDRAKLYVNGVLQPTTGTYPSINYEGGVNRNVIHTIGTVLVGGVPYTPSEPKGEWTDYFFVDGQALTPDVFGYYKKGDGYISAGSTQATDFKRGQWVPKAPKVIKSVINARGGFGVNGFYLPMNDDSNFGADFHCEPNSIIKLKGEDFNEYPQPRNGAPETTDGYVSQLREDPYAANLVLAVPGIALENTNTELVTNGTFDTGISGWTGYNSTPTWDSVNQRLVIDAPTEFDGAQTSSGISVSANTNYTLSLDVFLGTAGGVRLQVRNSANSGGIVLLDVDASGAYVLNFNSGANTSVYIRLITTGGNTGTAYFDNISLKEAIPVRDYSADIKGSGTNKTVTANGSAGIAVKASYYGSALSFDGTGDGFKTQDISSDFSFGTGDFTFESWVYSTDVGSSGNIFGDYYENATNTITNWQLLKTSDEELLFYLFDSSGAKLLSTAPSSYINNQWNHVVAERYNGILTIYVNGVSGATDTAFNYNVGRGRRLFIGIDADESAEPFRGYIQDVRIYKGVAKYKGGFDVPKPYTPVNFANWRAVPDTTANNFATLNPLHGSTSGTYTNGNLTIGNPGTNNIMEYHSTIGMTQGKWYCEARVDDTSDSNRWHFGVSSRNLLRDTSNQNGNNPGDITITHYDNDSLRLTSRDESGNQTVYSSGLPNVVTGDILGVALNITTPVDNWVSGNTFGTVQFYRNGSTYGPEIPLYRHQLPDGTGGTTPYTREWFFAAHARSDSDTTVNFGQNPTFSGSVSAGTYTDSNGKGLFKYEPPAGFLALCEDNLPAPTIRNPGEHFKTVLYEGDGSSGRSITGVGFKPDLIWFKGRNAAIAHVLNDTVRGVTEHLNSDSTAAASTPTYPYLNSVNNDGFSLLGGSSSGGNISGRDMVAWCWKAGGPAVTNTDGTITSQVSANQTAGFSIVSTNGSGTAGHGLNATPQFIISKRTTLTSAWSIQHHQMMTSSTGKLLFSSAGVVASSAPYMFNANDTTFEPVYTDPSINYCWVEIEGYSKFGSYVGNGSADGPFVYCGFKPAFVMIKASSASGDWLIMDSSRDSTNPNSLDIYANLTNTETNFDRLDFLSNGFKNRATYSNNNGDGVSYIFAAFAESPFQTANAK